MIESLKVRLIVVLLVVAGAIIWNVPNFTQVGENWWFSKSKIVYGLDIQGGLHLVMGVDVDAVVTEKSERQSKALKDEFKDSEVGFKDIVVNPENKREIIVSLNTGAEGQAVENHIAKYYPSTIQVLDKTDSAVTLKFFDSKVLEYKKQVVDQAIEVIRNRIDSMGVAEPSIAAQGEDRILVQLPGIEDSQTAKDLINKTARLDFRVVSKEMQVDELQRLIQEAEAAGNYKLSKESLKYTAYVKKINEDLKAKLPKNTRVVFKKLDSAVNLEAGRVPMLVETNSDLHGGELEDASVRPDEYGKPEVNFRFTVAGRRKFAELTERAAGGFLAIVLDDVVKSDPSVKEKIDSSQARITLGSGGNYQDTLAEAQFIATTLRAGALPAALEQLEERTVGPTLGADSIEKGKKAGIIGGILVLIFMIGYYRKLGVVADIALALNVLLILAILTSLGATLTLPGVAGIVLTVGMAVDANVIIFERIKEELLKGAGIGAAVKDGFGHAFSAIIDANITTAAVCIVLMYFGTGPVRGFAVTLICGIITSMFTAIFVSRAIIELMIGRLGVKNLITVK